MTRRSRPRLLAALLLALGLLAACAPDTGGDPAAAPGDAPEDEATDGGDGDTADTGDEASELSGTVTVWSWRTEDVAGYEAIFAAFEEQHPDVTVEFVPHVNTEYNTILSTGLTEAGGPDVMQLRAYGQLQPFIESGNVMPLDDEVDVSSFSEEMLEGARGVEDGQLYGVPFAIQTVQMFYNRDIFAEHGLEEPTTWDEFTEILETLDGADVTPIATTAADAWMLPIVHEVLGASRYGGPEFRERLHAGETDFTDPDYVASLETVAELEPYMPDDVVGVAYTDAQVLFTTGQAAMFPGGSFEVGFFADQAPDMDLGVFSVPPPPDAPVDSALVPGWMDGSFGVNANSDNSDAALELVRWMATEDFAQRFTDELGQLSAMGGIEPSDEVLAEIVEGYEANPSAYLLLVDFRYGEPMGTDLLGEGLQQVFLGDAEPADVAEDLQRGVSQWWSPEDGPGGAATEDAAEGS